MTVASDDALPTLRVIKAQTIPILEDRGKRHGFLDVRSTFNTRSDSFSLMF